MTEPDVASSDATNMQTKLSVAGSDSGTDSESAWLPQPLAAWLSSSSASSDGAKDDDWLAGLGVMVVGDGDDSGGRSDDRELVL